MKCDSNMLSRNIIPVVFSPVAVLALSLFPYIGLGALRLPTEVQAWAPIAGWFVVLGLLVQGRLSLLKIHIVIICFGILFFIYVPIWLDVDYSQYFRKSCAVLLMSSVFIVSQHLRPLYVYYTLTFSTVLWLIYAVIGVLNNDLYFTVVRFFVPNALGSLGERGVTSLAPEATDFGFTMVYFWVMCRLTLYSMKSLGLKRNTRWLQASIIACIIFSRSAAGIISLVVVVITEVLIFDKKRMVNRMSKNGFFLGAASTIGVFIFAFNVPETGIRGLDLMSKAISNPYDLVNTTVSYRLSHNLVGFFGFWDSDMLGKGAGTFTILGTEVYHDYNIQGILGLDGWYKENVPKTISESPLATFPVIIFEYGLLGCAFLLVLFFGVIRSNVYVKYGVLFLLTMTWIQSFPIAYPLFWVLLGIVFNPNYVAVPKIDTNYPDELDYNDVIVQSGKG